MKTTIDTRTKLFMALFGVLGVALGSVGGYYFGLFGFPDVAREMEWRADDEGYAALFTWIGGIGLCLFGVHQGRLLGKRLRKRDYRRELRTQFADQIAEHERDKAERGPDGDEKYRLAHKKRRLPWQKKKNLFIPWP